MGQTYYEILEISQDASLKDVKNAYITKIRQFPAESHPSMFRLIQEAYNVLSDEEKREQYDIEFLHGDEIKNLLTLANEAYDLQNYEQAQFYYSELLKIQPKNTEVMNLCALSMLQNGQIEEAISKLKKAILLEDDNSTYYFNLGSAYERNKEYTYAIRYYKQALIRNPIDFAIVSRLSHLYYDLDDFENAWDIVERTMNKEQVNSQLKFLYIKLLIETAILKNANFETKIAMKYAQKFIENTPDKREYALYELKNLTIDFAKANHFKGAKQIIDWIVSKDNHPDFTDLQKTIDKDYLLFNEFELISNDEKIIQEIRLKVYLYLYGEELEDFQEKSEIINNNTIIACEEDREYVKASLKRVRGIYPTIYNELHSWFEIVESYVE